MFKREKVGWATQMLFVVTDDRGGSHGKDEYKRMR